MTKEDGAPRVLEAKLIHGTETPVGEGNNSPARCVVELTDGSFGVAILKRIPLQSVVIEVFCALVLRRWGLHVPQPLIVQEENGAISFASLDGGFPNLKQHLDFDDELPADVRHELRLRAAELVSKFNQTPLAIAADEAIQNRDRHLANILWDGAEVSWIDHEGALGNCDEEDQNRLVSLVCLLGSYEKVRVGAISAAENLQQAPKIEKPSILTAELPGGIDLLEVLSTGLTALSQRVILRFPQPHDLFGAPTSQ